MTVSQVKAHFMVFWFFASLAPPTPSKMENTKTKSCIGLQWKRDQKVIKNQKMIKTQKVKEKKRNRFFRYCPLHVSTCIWDPRNLVKHVFLALNNIFRPRGRVSVPTPKCYTDLQ